MKKKTLEYNYGNVMEKVKFLSKMRVDFTLTMTNYTAKISTPTTEIKYLRKAQSIQFFAAAAKVRKDVSRFELPDIERENVRYYGQSINCKVEPGQAVYCVDINSAYAQVLINNEIITPETFAYLQKLEKQDRLGAVGMLASKKEHLIFEGGEITDKGRVEISELEPWFLLCVQKTFEAMFSVFENWPKNFIFSWVDGVYLKGCENYTAEQIAELVQQHLKSQNFNSKIEKCQNFEVLEFETHYTMTYDNPKFPEKAKNPRKEISIKKPELNLKRMIADSIFNRILKK